MAQIVKALGIIILALGIIIVVKPSLMRSFIEFAKVGKRVYIGGVVRIVIGLFLLFSIPHVTLPWICGIMGVIAMIAGILFFVLGVTKMHAFLDKISALPENKFRLLPIVPIIIGVLLIYAA